MQTLEEIQRAVERLPLDDRLTLEGWLQHFNNPPTGGSRVEEARPEYAVSDLPFMTLEEFLEFEERSSERHEFVNGVVFAMTGPTVRHERIKTNLTLAFGNHLGRGSCQVFSSHMQLRIQREANEIVYLPDVMVDCRREDWGKDFIRSPKLVVEILSPSTHLIDRREKCQNYRLIPSVEEYVLAAQDAHKLSIYRRKEGWRPDVYSGPEAIAEFGSIELSLPLIEIYHDILDMRG